MSRIKRFQIDSDDQIARAILRPGTESERALMARAQLVGIFYRRAYAESASKRGESPFAQKDQLSVTDPAAFHVRNLGNRIEIAVEAPAAEFVESGNEPGPNGLLKIEVKPSKVRSKRGKRGGTILTLDSGSQVRRQNGKLFIFSRKAKGFQGYHLLERAVKQAFGIR